MNKIDDIRANKNQINENVLVHAIYQLFKPEQKQKRLVIDFQRLEQIEKENYQKQLKQWEELGIYYQNKNK
jgi:hypothetical protein